MEVFRWLSVVWLCLISGEVFATEQKPNATHPDDLVGAVCVIRHGSQLVLMSEVITQKMSLPGGYIDINDTPEQAAAREAFEETGIDVTVSHLIQHRGRAAIFACVANSPILVSSYRDPQGFPIVASWSSPHFGTEIERVYLIDPDNIDASEYRYENDAGLLSLWREMTPESDTLEYVRLDGQVNILDKFELGLIEGFQHTVQQWSPVTQGYFKALVTVLNVPGEVWFMMILVILIAGKFGHRVLLEIVFLLLLGMFITSLLKHVMGSPRPYFIIPELQKVDAKGFGFPSSHTLLATLLWGMLWHGLSRHLSLWCKVLLALAAFILIVGQGMARVWFGVHYISDIVITIMLGVMIVSALNVWRSYERSPLQACLNNRWFWFYATTAVGVVMSYSLIPAHFYIFAAMLGIFFSVEYSVQVDQKRLSLRWEQSLLACCVLAGMAAAIYVLFYYLAAQQTVSLIVLAIKCTGCVMMSAWLFAGSAWLRQRLSSEHVNCSHTVS